MGTPINEQILCIAKINITDSSFTVTKLQIPSLTQQICQRRGDVSLKVPWSADLLQLDGGGSCPECNIVLQVN